MLSLSNRAPLSITMLLVIAALWCADALALTVTADKDFNQAILGPGLQFTKAEVTAQPERQIGTLKDWLTLADRQVKFGFSDTAYWIRFNINNTAQVPQDFILEIGNVYLDYIHLYVLDNTDKVTDKALLGDRIPATSRSMQHAHYLHPLAIEPGQSITVMLYVNSSSAISVPLTLWERDAFIEFDFLRTVSFGLFFGILLMLSFYHLMISLLTRDASLLFYATFIFGILLIFLLREGVITSMVWPGSGIGTESANLIAVGMACFGISFFTSRILMLNVAMPTTDKMMKLLALATLLPGLLVAVMDYGLLIRISLSIAMILTVLYVIALVQRVREKYPAATHLITASSFAIIGITTANLTVLGLLPVNALTQTTIYGCITLMGLFYSLSISYRVNMDRALREEAQSKLTHRLDELVREQTDELEKVNSQLKTISITDGLTQLYNRRHLDNVLPVEFNRAYRERTPLSVVLFDIDHFKKLNDTHGHSFGDLCLKRIGEVVHRVARRPADIAARYGGEEFILLLPETACEGAFHLAQRIQQALAQEEVRDGEHSTVMTVSIGVACEIPEQKNQHEELLKRADQWLYEAKRKGRNRIEGDPHPPLSADS